MPTLIVILLLAAFLLAGDFLAWVWPSYAPAETDKNRFASLDGLRGFLALIVFLHHGAATQNYLLTKNWLVVGVPLEMIGPAAVTLFFFITGFLFWNRHLNSPKPLSLVAHYRSRFFRIAPLYTFSAVILFTLVLINAAAPFTSSDLISSARLLFSAGTLSPMPIAGIDPNDFNANVVWTLETEWHFYIIFPLLVLLGRQSRYLVPTLGFAYIVYCSLFHKIPHMIVIFFGGIMLAELHKRLGAPRWTRGVLPATLALIPAVAIIVFAKQHYSNLEYLCLLPLTFYLISGGSFGGLLLSRGAQLLGKISFSTYLLHAIALYFARPILAHFVTTPVYWLAILLIGIGVILISVLTFRFIELPFITLERKLRRKVKTPAPVTAPEPLPQAQPAA